MGSKRELASVVLQVALRIPAFAGTCLWGGARALGHNHQGIVGGESL